MTQEKSEAQLKRLSVQIFIQLPEDREGAMRVLQYAREMVEWENGEGENPPLKLVR